MLRIFGDIMRVLVGMIVAGVVAAAVQVLFALTPAELASAGLDYWSAGGILMLRTASLTILFASPFMLLAAIVSEWNGIRHFAYHGLVGIGVAILAHTLLYLNQTNSEPSIVNSYAAAAYLTAGFVGGFTYWLVAGRFAHRTYTRSLFD